MRKIEKIAKEVFSSFKPETEIITDYDRIADVLYVNFVNSPPQKADFGRRFGDYIIRIKGGRVIGVTILNANQHSKKHFKDCPPILKSPATLILA